MQDKKPKNHFWDFFFLLSYPVGVGLVILAFRHSDSIGGTALGGSHTDGKFLILTGPDHFKVVSAFDWITDLVLFILMLCLVLVMIVGMGYFFFKYLFPYVSRSLKGPGNKLS